MILNSHICTPVIYIDDQNITMIDYIYFDNIYMLIISYSPLNSQGLAFVATVAGLSGDLPTGGRSVIPWTMKPAVTRGDDWAPFYQKHGNVKRK